MTNPFKDQAQFMGMCDQTVGKLDSNQYKMYCALIEEEFKELQEAVANNDEVEQLDALIDILVVTLGALHSLGVDAEGAWEEVMDTNFRKCDPMTNKVRKREDGKVLKPIGWQPPQLKKFLKR